LSSFCLFGKIIGKDNHVKKGLTVLAYDSDQDFTGDDFLGKSKTDEYGFFKIKFTSKKFKKFWEFLEGSPDIYLVIKEKENELLRTDITKTKNQIIYHIKLNSSKPNPKAPDIYGDNFRKLVFMLNDVGLTAGQENHINLGLLQNLDLSEEIQKRLRNANEDYLRAMENFGQMTAMLNGVLYSNLESGGVRVVNYDGPQVKRNAWKEGDVQVIIWPRDEDWV